DIKQSIYSFRKANPENFKKAISKQEMQLIKLNKNFRSSQGVIDFVNALFQCIMTETYCGEVNYAENEQLNFGAEIYQNLDAIYQRTQILFPQDNTSQFENADKFLLQAECIADKIAHMIADKTLVMTPTGTRPCEYKDFCVLMRTKSNQKIMAESFKKRNIPFMCQDNNGFLMLPEIRLIWNLLKITDNPMTDVAMASVLLSPLYGFTTDELAILKLLGNDKKRLYLQIRYVAEAKQELPQEYSALSQKCNLFLEQLEQIRTLADKLPLEICIHEIYDMTDLLSLQSLYENAEQRRENLEIFAQQAQSYRDHADLTAQSCLSGWLRYLTHIQESENSEDFAPKTAFYVQANFVSVKTIHKAKGLEYPFVFIANLERKFNFSNPSNPTVLLTNEAGIIGLKLIDRKNYSKIKTVAFSYLDNIRILKEKHEEMRLLYVALTRAKQQLFLVMDDKTCKTDKNSILLENCPEIAFMLAKEAKNMQEWILQFLSAIGEAEHVQQAVINHQSNHSDFADYIIWNPDQQIQTQEEQKKCIIPTALPDKNLVSHMQKQIAYEYNTSQTILPAKYSVTELSHEETEIQIHEPEFLLKDFEGNTLKLKGKAKGTAIHKIMQLIDFKKAEENLLEELEQMQKAGILSVIETEALEPRKLEAFFKSDLYQRIAVSDNIQKEKQLFVKIAELNLPENSELAKNYANTDGIIIGTLDLLFHESDGWVIVDYKTDKSQEESELLKKYSKQLGLYQKAVELILGAPVK
ncbi:MAG: PD-(D/E)XK nuclease family protein, partial [Oscillospiraceae bacterium]|nr:PD-(D/E)XK nuclease family protein [Oscillospiraceae bacterium]